MNVIIDGKDLFRRVTIRDFDSIGTVHVIMTPTNNSTFNERIGELSNLHTQDKTNLVSAINEVFDESVRFTVENGLLTYEMEV